ncbi:MAG: hypothetical protein ACP5OA_03700 [Candidatus Woesearchaeota archaeon]
MVREKVVKEDSSKSITMDDKEKPVIGVIKKPKNRHHRLIRALAKSKAIHNKSNRLKDEKIKSTIENLEPQENIAVKDIKTANPEKLEEKIEKEIVQEPTIKKSRKKHHRLIRALAKSKAIHNKSKRLQDEKAKSIVEKLELEANIAVKDSKMMTPERLEEKVETEKVPEQAESETLETDNQIIPPQDIVDSKIISPDPISGEDVHPNIPTVKDSQNTAKTIRFTVLIITILLLAFWCILLAMSIQTTVDKTVERATTITVNEPVDMSIERYVKNASLYLGYISVIGLLREEEVNGGSVNYVYRYIIDEDGNRIKLVDSRDFKDHDLKFLLGETSKETYNVSGTYKYINYEYIIDITSIIRQDRPMHEVEVNKLENVTIKVPGFKIDIIEGWNRIIGK